MTNMSNSHSPVETINPSYFGVSMNVFRPHTSLSFPHPNVNDTKSCITASISYKTISIISLLSQVKGY